MRNLLVGALLGIAPILLSTFCAAAEPLDLTAKIDPHARAILDEKLVVGFVVGVYKDGQTQILPYGEKAKGGGVVPDGDTVYEIGSVSKVFTGVLLADLVERGLVGLDDPVQKYLPAAVTLPVIGGKPITLEQLSTQRSGLPRMPDNFQPADAENPYADYSVEQMMAFVRGVKLDRPPGKYEYSNLGVGLLGHVLATRAGLSYEELLHDRVTGPLEMLDTRIKLDAALLERMATPYDGSLAETKRWDIPTLAGAGGSAQPCGIC